MAKKPQECIDLITQAKNLAGEDVEVLTQLASDLIESAEGLEPSKLAQSMKRALKEQIADIENRKIMRIQTEGALKESMKVIKSAKRAEEGMAALIGESQDRFYGSSDSIWLRSSETESRLNAILETGMSGKQELQYIYRSGEKSREIAMELFELRDGGSPGISKSPEALEIAKLIRTMQDEVIESYRASGVPMRYLPGYIVRNSHDIIKMRSAGKEKWVADTMQLLDKERTFRNTGEAEEVLGSVYDSIIEGRRPDPDSHIFDDTEVGLNKYHNISKKQLREKVLHFEDGEAWHLYNESYGRSGLKESLDSSIKMHARQLALINKFGAIPSAGWNKLKKQVRKSLEVPGKEKELASFDKKSDSLDQLFKYTSGDRLRGDLSSDMVMTAKQGALFLQELKLLGLTGIAATQELASSAMIVKSATGKNMFQSIKDQITSSAKLLRPQDQKVILRKMAILTEMFNKVDVNSMIESGGTVGKINKARNIFHKTTGLNYITKLHKSATVFTFASDVADNAKLSFDKLDPYLSENFIRVKIGAKEWEFIKKGVDEVDLSGGKVQLITPEAIIKNNPEVKNIKEISQRYSVYLNDLARRGSPEAGARELSAMNMGTTPGTWSNAGLGLLMQFKGYPLAAIKTTARIAKSNPDFDWRGFSLEDLKRNKGSLYDTGQYMASMMAMAYATMTLYNLAKGKEAPDPTSADTWRDAAIRSGVGGLFADTVLGRYNNLAGPTAGMLLDIKSAVNGDKRAQAKILSTRSLPLQNHIGVVNPISQGFYDGIYKVITGEDPPKK